MPTPQEAAKIQSPFPDDAALNTWSKDVTRMMKTTEVGANDAFPLPAQRVAYALQRLSELLESPVERAEAAPKETQTPPKVTLNQAEKDTLAAIKKLTANGVVPTHRAIAAERGLKGHAGVTPVVDRLAAYGLLKVIGEGRIKRIALT